MHAQSGLMLSAELLGHSNNSGLSYIPSSLSGYLTFPNAFRWNHEGPTGGYWSDNNVDDCTFRPFFSNITTYRLEIYNRSGFKVYESSDLNKGWDGYLKDGTVAMQGVYIWKAVGKFNDGAFFNKIGDVTFLH
jgi:hypothetical protein